jgi:hypothetical protein
VLYTRPYVTRRFIAYAGDSWTSDLSLAVMVLDSFTEEPAQTAIRVRLRTTPATAAEKVPLTDAIRNPSGFFYFERLGGLAAGPYTLVIEPDSTTTDWYYLESNAAAWGDTFERIINLPMPNALNPVETATLVPKSSYPFPGNATLVRGKVTQGGAAVSEAIVSTTYQRVAEGPPNTPPPPPSPLMVRTLTDREGDFVLFFRRLPNKTQPITLKAEKNGNQFQQPGPVMITEGETLKDQFLNLP